MKDIVIVGGGPAGLTAAIYAARAGKTVRVYEKENPGGQILFSPMVDNYPGLPHVSGTRFVESLTEQVTELGVELVMEEVISIERTGAEDYLVHTDSGSCPCHAVILATGVAHRRLGLEGEEDLVGCGVSYCAVCDGAFYKAAPVAVVGGGDTALQDAIFLASTASEVYLIHRRDEFRGEKSLVNKVLADPRIHVLYSHVVDSLVQEDMVLQHINVKDLKTGEVRPLQVEGLFLAVGQTPQSEAFRSMIDMDEQGYYYAGEDALTNEPGIFAAGDARLKSVRQLTTAVGDGAAAAMAACRYLELQG
ncbi:MAG: FAD-dependent oxidoreductase [Lachnospiraceae bacterium]|nr:FAD-dependent oxidoreductase [Lachnospiraceae bacterium]